MVGATLRLFAVAADVLEQLEELVEMRSRKTTPAGVRHEGRPLPRWMSSMPELGLERSHVVAEGRLGHVELLGRPAEA